MKKFATFLILKLLMLSAFCAETVCIEGEDFQFQGDWTKDSGSGQSFLITDVSKTLPTTVFEVKEGGKYTLWASALDVSNFRQGMRQIKIGINGFYPDTVAGKHGRDGFYWEKLGEVNLEKGENIATIKIHTDHVRADAILLTNEAGYDPNERIPTPQKRKLVQIKPILKESIYEYDFPKIERLAALKTPKKVEIKSDKIAVIFTEKVDSNGKKSYVRSVKLLQDGKVIQSPDYDDEALILLKSYDIAYDGEGYYTRWNLKVGKAYIIVNGKKVETDFPPNNPYSVGEATLLRPINVIKKSETLLNIIYPMGVVGTLQIMPSGVVKFDLEMPVTEEAQYSFAFLGFNKCEKEEFTALFLPTMYQGTRTMIEPKMVENRLTSQPLAMVENKFNDASLTNALIANPENLPHEWSFKNRSFYGFSVSSPDSKIQTAIFQPILGGTNSLVKSGEKLKASWYILDMLGTWCDAFEFANKNVFKADKIREAQTCSLSDAAANIAKYLRSEDASGWSPIGKGRWNIESQYTTTQASPLTEIAISLLTDDEDYYRNISLPTIEFMLSRRGAHFGCKKPVKGSWFEDEMSELAVPSSCASADIFAGFNAITGNGNPWVKEFYYKNNSLRSVGSNWSSMLGLYIAEPSAENLEKAKKACDDWIKKVFHARNYGDPNVVPFINAGLYPYWWYLPDMYEITQDKKYLDYAKIGAFYTLSSLWSYPSDPDGEITIHKGNVLNGIRVQFWKGGVKERLGEEPNSTVVNMLAKTMKFKDQQFTFIMPEKKVPAEKVSRIGLGIEQHWTYKWSGNYHNILNPSWAAGLLKVYQYTNTDILMKYSRHSIVGRYANFPGYYIKDFTDIQHDELYPYKGPDTTNLYTHHAPVHFAQTFDYLMAQIELASKNKIRFPYVRQQGYVWFVSRIFAQPGKVFDDTLVRPYLDKQAIRPDSVKVSTLMGRGQNSIWAIVLNDSAKDIETTLTLDPSAKSLKGAKTNEDILIYNSDGIVLPQKLSFFGEKKVKIPALSLVALKIPAENFDPQIKSQPLGEGAHIVKQNLANGWKDLHVFRIRSPFGKDSIFAVITGALYRENASVKMIMKINGKSQTLQRDFYPFEFSVYPVSQNDDVELEFEISEKSKETIYIKDIILKK